MLKKILGFSIIALLLGVCSVASVAAQKLAEFKLPRGVPASFEIEWSEYGGMVQSFEIIRLKGKTLTHEQKKVGQKVSTKWTADVTAEDVKALYELFVETRFDLIKNEERKGIVYDAGSQAVRMTIDGGGGLHNVQYGPNSPLSDDNKLKYQKLANAIKALADKYRSHG
jgi:hypothetical protein